MTDIDAVDFYWRPGCPFCSSLERNLVQQGLPLRKLNIWEDDRHAAAVRQVADGNETVPTVVVGAVSMVNPRPAEVLRAVREQAPQLLPAGVDGS